MDKVQFIGALTGLINKLVLCESAGSSRLVIVPDGSVKFSPDRHHVRVNIDVGNDSHVKYYVY